MADDVQPPRKRARGPYRRWMETGGPPPRTTALDRRHRFQGNDENPNLGNTNDVPSAPSSLQNSPDFVSEVREPFASCSNPEEETDARIRLPFSGDSKECGGAGEESLSDGSEFLDETESLKTASVSSSSLEDSDDNEEESHDCGLHVNCDIEVETQVSSQDEVQLCALMTNQNDDIHETSQASRKDRVQWDKPLLPFVPTTKFEVYLMILHLSFRHSLTGPLIENLLQFVNCIFAEEVVPSSEYFFKKLFKPASDMKVHFYCQSCWFYLGEANDFKTLTIQCESCDSVCNVKELKDNFFLTLGINDQLENILLKPDLEWVSREGREEGVYKDIVDGDLYRNLCQPGQLLADKNSLSLTFNVDGAQVFKNSRKSLWPIQCVVNELSPKFRFKHSNVILCGLWFGKSSPNMSAFLKGFKEEVNLLSNDGVRKPTSNGEFVTCPVFALTCSVDSVCKPKVQCLKQFNGAFGCGYCLHPNLSVEGNMLRYIAVNNDKTFLHFPPRNHENILNDMLKAYELNQAGLLVKSRVGDVERNDHVNGVKGLSVLADMKGFDLVYGFVIDYMHQLLEGVTATLISIICNGQVKSKKFWKNENYDVSTVNQRLENVIPPRDMSAQPKSLLSLSEWKGKDFRQFLFFLMLPLFHDMLKESYYDNLKILVNASFILLSDNITREQLHTAASMLQDFVRDFNILYGDACVTYNIHLCTHLAVIVKMWGPLWAYSTFVFESGNGHLTRLVKGTKGVVTQIGRKHLTVKCVSDLLTKHPVSEKVLSFCSEIMNYKYVKKSKNFETGRAFGGPKLSQITDSEMVALADAGVTLSTNFITYYNRAVKDGVVFTCTTYTKTRRTDDTCIKLTNGTFAIIVKFVEIPNSSELYMFIRPIRISVGNNLAEHIFTCASDTLGALKLAKFCEISRKSVKIVVNAGGNMTTFVAAFPNIYEQD